MTQTEGRTVTASAAAPEPSSTPEPSRRSMLRHPLIRLLFTLLLVGGVGYALWLSWQDPRLADFEWHFSPLPIGIALLTMLFTSAGTAIFWLVIFRGLGGHVETRGGARIFLVTNLGKYLPGKVMHAAGRVAFLQQRGQP